MNESEANKLMELNPELKKWLAVDEGYYILATDEEWN